MNQGHCLCSRLSCVEYTEFLRKEYDMKYFLNLRNHRYLLSKKHIVVQLFSRTHFEKRSNKVTVHKKRGMMILLLVRHSWAVWRVRHHDFRGENGCENNQDDADYSGFENKPCQKWLKEQRLFSSEKRRPRKGKINGLQRFEGKPRINRQENKF